MSTVKKPETAKVEAKAADKVEAVKITAKTEPAKKTEAPKAVKKAEPAKKAEAPKVAKKAEAPKAVKKAEAPKVAKKPVAKKAVEEVYIEFNGAKVATADIVAKVVEATGKKASSIKVLNVYIQPETGKTYYTVDGERGEIEFLF